MTLTHEHVLACQRCDNPLLVTRLVDSKAQCTTKSRLVLIYEQNVASIFGGKFATPSYLRSMQEDTTVVQPQLIPSMTSLHVLYMEGFERQDTRRDFAEHCDLDPAILESHFDTISRMTGAEVGACWCECHAMQVDQLGLLEMAQMGVEDTYVPFILAPITEHEEQDVLGSQGKKAKSRRAKRKSWGPRLRPRDGSFLDGRIMER